MQIRGYLIIAYLIGLIVTPKNFQKVALMKRLNICLKKHEQLTEKEQTVNFRIRI